MAYILSESGTYTLALGALGADVITGPGIFLATPATGPFTTNEDLGNVGFDIEVSLATGTTLSSASGTNLTVAPTVALLSSTTLNTNGGTITLGGGLTSVGALSGLTINITGGGTLDINSSLVSADVLQGATINFGTGGGTLNLQTGGTNLVDVNLLSGVTINNFGAGDNIVVSTGTSTLTTISNLSYSSATGETTVTFSNGDSVVLTGQYTDQVGGTGTYIQTTFSGGTTELTTLCFCEGTMIATPNGEVPVETLQAGDLVRTADGRDVPVRWLGYSTVSTRFADPLRSLPVRIPANALADGVPSRDLMLSPDHALFIDGVLVQAGALVDDVTITRVRTMPDIFRFYHVETAAHDLLLAEGTPVESFVDHVDRMNFDNWAEYEALCGEAAPIRELPYPRAKSARQVPYKLRACLAARAATHKPQECAA